MDAPKNRKLVTYDGHRPEVYVQPRGGANIKFEQGETKPLPSDLADDLMKNKPADFKSKRK